MDRIKKPNFESEDARGILREVTKGHQWQQLNQYERKKGCIVGNHYHKEMEEFFFIIKGHAKVKIQNITTGETEEFIVKSGDAFNIFKNEVHALKFFEDTIFVTLLSKDFNEKSPDIYQKIILEE